MPNLQPVEQAAILAAADVNDCVNQAFRAYGRLSLAGDTFDPADIVLINDRLNALFGVERATFDDLNAFVLLYNQPHNLLEEVPAIRESVCRYALTLVPTLSVDEIEAYLGMLDLRAVTAPHVDGDVRNRAIALIHAADPEELLEISKKPNISHFGVMIPNELRARAHHIIDEAVLHGDRVRFSNMVEHMPPIIFQRTPAEAEHILQANTTLGNTLDAQQLKKIAAVPGANIDQKQLAENFIQKGGTIDPNTAKELQDAVRARNLRRK